jgi:D-hydroxyproline dehydrogenase subunit alpha
MTGNGFVPSVAIVGAGVAGLAAATELAPRGRVTVIDRLPAVGGVLGYEHQLVRDLSAEASASGAAFSLGTTALRWQDQRLLLAGPEGIRWLSAETLIYAGGTRPAILAELPAAGPRLAGVLPAPVAEHLLEAEVLLGHRVVVAGGGHWARVILERLAHQDCSVTFVAEGADGAVDAGPRAGDKAAAELAAGRLPAEAVITGWALHAVAGSGRITEVILELDGRRLRVACDALVLAGGERPLRNVDGAVFDPAPGVVYIQPHGPQLMATDVAAAARVAAHEIQTTTDGALAAPGKVS